jgi:hypothetical protein
VLLLHPIPSISLCLFHRILSKVLSASNFWKLEFYLLHLRKIGNLNLLHWGGATTLFRSSRTSNRFLLQPQFHHQTRRIWRRLFRRLKSHWAPVAQFNKRQKVRLCDFVPHICPLELLPSSSPSTCTQASRYHHSPIKRFTTAKFRGRSC